MSPPADDRCRAPFPRRLSSVYRLHLLIGCITLGANAGAAILSFVYDVLLLPTPKGAVDAGLVRRNVVVFVVDLVLSVAFVTVAQLRSLLRLRAWLNERRPISDAERRQLSRLPGRLTAPVILTWIAAALLYPTMNWTADPGHIYAWRALVGIVFAGLIATTLTYLLVECTLRPVFGRAFDVVAPSRSRRRGVHDRLLITWAVGSGIPLVWIGLSMLGRNGDYTRLTGSAWYLVIFGLVGGLSVTAVATHSVTDPIARARDALQEVEAGNLDVHVEVTDRGELGQLQTSVNAMVRELRERERLRDLFGKHVGSEVAQAALARGAELGGEQCEASVLFVDLVGSTSLAERHQPADVVAMLDAFFAAIEEPVRREGGWINKFAGDGALCVFGPPVGSADHATRALRAARGVQERLGALAHEYPDLAAGVGVSSGSVIAGNVGTSDRYEYTVIGAPVNQAARLTEIAKDQAGGVVAAAATVDQATRDESALWGSAGEQVLRGMTTSLATCVPLTDDPRLRLTLRLPLCVSGGAPYGHLLRRPPEE
jgi:adenylate cyclase